MEPAVATDEFVSDPEWERILTKGHRPLLFWRGVMKRLPTDPRCKVCASPFAGIGGIAAGVCGFKPSRKNPYLCGHCIDSLQPGGALVDIGVLFADLRGSTTLGESMSAGRFAQMLNRFYRVATETLLAHDGLIDKLIGDEVMALFIPGIAGPDYRRKACEAGAALIRALKSDGAATESLPFGVGVHCGPAFVGNVGGGGIVDFTALGDTVNTGARLQAFAGPGELVMSEEAFALSEDLHLQTEAQHVVLKGKAEPFAVRIARP